MDERKSVRLWDCRCRSQGRCLEVDSEGFTHLVRLVLFEMSKRRDGLSFCWVHDGYYGYLMLETSVDIADIAQSQRRCSRTYSTPPNDAMEEYSDDLI